MNEGSTASNTGTWSDPGLDTVTLSASTGTVVKNTDGTWSWSFATNDGPDQTQTVTITATDSDGAITTTTFALVVTNVAPSLAKTNASVSVNEGSTASNTAVKVLINGVDRGTFLLSSFVEVIVYGKGGDDDIEIVAALTQEAFLFGDLGNDRLKGGNGPNALVGGDGDDELIGSQGNDVLIGGRGVDRLVGNQGDDLLVAGFTDHDSNLVALCAILKEWSRTDLGYQARVDDIWYGRGWNGSYRLNNVTRFNRR